jgi:uncharacterized iron-regulated membrane protein
MRQWFRSHLTFANFISLLALFLVLTGGTAVALSGSNTVQTDDLGPGSQVTAPDVATNAVNGADVINNTITGADTALGYTRPQASSPTTGLDETSLKEVQVDCPAGSKLTGGGYVLATSGGVAQEQLNATRSYAVDDNTWLVRAVEIDDTLVGVWQLTVVANCLNG